MMFQIIEVLLVFAISFLVKDVHSQIFFEGANFCDRNSRCIVLQQCPALYYNQNADIRTCGGNRRNQRVCCPINAVTTTTRVPIQWQTVVTPTPPWNRPVPYVPSRPFEGQSASECGESKVVATDDETNILTPLILNGYNATQGMFPWMVAITKWERRPRAYTPYCTGFLIDRRHVLSAAHCFEDERLEIYQTRIGRVNQNEGEIYRISRIVSHEGYRPRMFYDDIAILTLERPVTNPDIVPICLPNEEVLRQLDSSGLTVTGWGRTTKSKDGPLSILLQYLPLLQVVENQKCNRIMIENTSRGVFQRQFSQGINTGFICAGIEEGDKDSCGGDSGGPLMVSYKFRWYAVGIVSFGIECGKPGVPGGYTRISEHLDWIAENTRD